MRLKSLILAAALVPAAAYAQTALTTTNYQQNFNTLASTGSTGTALPPGIAIIETGSNGNATYGIGTGSSNTGNTYSFGAAGSTDRALGSLASGSLESVFGFLFTNGLNATINSFNISYVGEQWRRGTSPDDLLTFEYSTNATSLSSGTWTSVSALDFVSLFTTRPESALDGNLAANQRNLGATINGLSIASGGNFGFRWTDVNSTGSDHGLAVDNFSLSANVATAAVPEPATWLMMILGFGGLASVLRRGGKAARRIRFA